MPVEFAIRPRIHLREDKPPRAPSRYSRWRLPRFALPAALYWAAIGGICYGIIRLHDAPEAEPVASADELAPDPGAARLAAPANEAQPTRDVPERTAPPQASPLAEPPQQEAPPPAPIAESSPEPPVAAEPPERAVPERTLGADVSAALLAPRVARREREGALRERDLGRSLADSDNDLLREPNSQSPEPRPAPAVPRGSGSSLPSCEAAAAAAVQDLDFASSDRTADLPSEAIAGVLENGAWLGSCSVPESTKLDVCVAITGGRVMAATVTSRPADPALNACVKQRAAALQFPYSTRVDVARTRF